MLSTEGTLPARGNRVGRVQSPEDKSDGFCSGFVATRIVKPAVVQRPFATLVDQSTASEHGYQTKSIGHGHQHGSPLWAMTQRKRVVQQVLARERVLNSELNFLALGPSAHF